MRRRILIRKIFVDREKELKALNQAWEKQDFSFIIVYGRRRIGKTRLILEFLKKKKSVGVFNHLLLNRLFVC